MEINDEKLNLIEFFLSVSGSTDELALTAEPTDQVVSKNASAVIDCGAPAAWVQHQPPPLMEWKRDGVLLNFIGDTRR